MDLRGHLDLLLLTTLRDDGPAHGYAVITRLRTRSEGAFDLPEGTVYPALQRLERDETVVVNLRPDTELETEFVSFDRLRVLRVLERIAADLDNLSRLPTDAHADKESTPQDARARHRHELAEPPPEPKKLSHQEQRRALRAALGLPPL